MMRTALVSGAGRGIGAAIARHFLELGWNVSAGVRGGIVPDWAADPALAAHRGRLHVAAYDATEPGAETAWVAAARARFGAVDSVVANAGIARMGSVIEVADADLTAMFEVNVMAPRRLAQAAWDDLLAHGAGRFVILSSLSGKRVKSAMSGAYSLSKFAATALAHGLRHAGFDHGLRATALCPGLVATDMGRAVSDRDPQRMTRPEDIARIAALLISLPNEASVAEFAVNCQIEEFF
ncbi:MAG: SDR family NAD(P)-dependent oxidoreductase [Rubellimicrobium sp.]|nr:SDR family NAD(P)-dependent oxidoreductase [Rubellimicrobium sp.]